MIHIQREHHLPRQRVKEQLAGLAEMLKEDLQADYEWQDDTLTFKRTGASGQISVDDNQIDVQIELGLVLRPLSGKVEQAINDYLDQYLG